MKSTKIYLKKTDNGIVYIKEIYGYDKNGKILKNCISGCELFSDNYKGDFSEFEERKTGELKYKDFKNKKLEIKEKFKGE